MEGGRSDKGSERPRRRTTDATALFKTPEDLELAKRVSKLVPGITVEIFPKATPIDVEIAAQAHVLDAELRGVEVDTNVVYREAKFAIRRGGGVARIIVEALSDEDYPVATRFWKTFQDIKYKDNPNP